ncbi:PAS domain-containing sensor histidine kinase [Elusimicrobiota bacterium]
MKNKFVKFFIDLPIFPKIVFSFLFIGVFPILTVGVFEILARNHFKDFNINALVLCLALFITIVVAGILSQLILRPIRRLIDGAKKIEEGDFDHKIKVESGDELGNLAHAFNRMSSHLKENIKQKEIYLSAKATEQIASQVAHDIRSPLAALDSAAKDVAELPEEKRVIMRSAISRIRDIANHLLEKHRQAPSALTDKNVSDQLASEDIRAYLLSSLLEPVITEKRLQFGSTAGLEIDFRPSDDYYGLFARVELREFKRIISNLVNNAAEALGGKGAVIVTLAQEDNQITVKVKDNGEGIPGEILDKLGQRGETHGKIGGSGLGLYHARTSLEFWRGSLKIESEIGKGTTVTMTLPKADPPKWFVERLDLASQLSVVVLDDDQSIHLLWQGRFDSLKAKERGVEVVHFYKPEELREWKKRNHPHPTSPLKGEEKEKWEEADEKTLYLLDYELLGHEETGLSLIEELNLAGSAILVTSRFEEKAILEECLRLNVRMIPKGLAGFVPIAIKAVTPHPASPSRGEEKEGRGSAGAVLVDDDPLVHMTWKMAAESKGIKLTAFKNSKDFLAMAEQLPKTTHIYLDSELGEGVKGEDVAKELHEKGFTDLYLETGHPSEHFSHATWIKKVVGKEPPWQ